MAAPVITPWTIAPIRLGTKDGIVIVPGWTNGPLTIDWRAGSESTPGWGAYVIAATGQNYAYCAITKDFAKVTEAADRILPALIERNLIGAPWEKLQAFASDLLSIFRQHGGHSAYRYKLPQGVPTL